MTQPAPPPTPPAPAYPEVFDGIGALVVGSNLDPDALVERIPGLTWIAAKLTGADTGGDIEVRHCLERWRALGLHVGGWIYCAGPPDADVSSTVPWRSLLDFVVFNVEREYKADEGGRFEYAQWLVVNHHKLPPLPAAVTSYGGYKSSIDFGSFARAGWPILAQCYDAFRDGDEVTYQAVYPASGIHRLVRRLQLRPGEAVYRPESLT